MRFAVFFCVIVQKADFCLGFFIVLFCDIIQRYGGDGKIDVGDFADRIA